MPWGAWIGANLGGKIIKLHCKKDINWYQSILALVLIRLRFVSDSSGLRPPGPGLTHAEILYKWRLTQPKARMQAAQHQADGVWNEAKCWKQLLGNYRWRCLIWLIFQEDRSFTKNHSLWPDCSWLHHGAAKCILTKGLARCRRKSQRFAQYRLKTPWHLYTSD